MSAQTEHLFRVTAELAIELARSAMQCLAADMARDGNVTQWVTHRVALYERMLQIEAMCDELRDCVVINEYKPRVARQRKEALRQRLRWQGDDDAEDNRSRARDLREMLQDDP